MTVPTLLCTLVVLLDEFSYKRLLSPLALASYGCRFHDNLHFKVKLYPRTTEKLAKITVYGFVCLFCIQKLWKHIKHKYETSDD